MKRHVSRGPDDGVLGQMIGTDGEIVRLSLQDQECHATIWGQTGSGKSKLLQAIFLQHLSRGHGVCILEPHHDLSIDTLAYLDWGNEDYIPFNVPATKGPPETVALNVLEAMMRVWPELRRAPTFQTLFLSAMLVLIENQLPITYLYQLLTDGSFRDRCLQSISDPLILRSFGTYEQSRGSVRDAGSTLRRAFLLSFHQITRLSVGQPDNWLDIRRLMDEEKSLIVNLGNIGDPETRRLIGALLLVQIEQAALSRTDLVPSERRPWTVLVDEWPSFASTDAAIGNILAQIRKFGLRLYLSAQSTGQIASDRLQAALENCRLTISFGLGRESVIDQSRRIATLDPRATAIDPVTGRPHRVSSSEQFETLAQDLQLLSPRQAYVKMYNRPAVKIETLAVRSVPTMTRALDAVVEQYRGRYQRTRHEAEVACVPLDQMLERGSRVPSPPPFTLFGRTDVHSDETG